MNTEELVQLIGTQQKAFAASLEKSTNATNELATRLMGLEQKMLAWKPGSGGPARAPSWGSQVSAHARLKAFVEAGARGKCSIPIKAEISTPSGQERGDLIAPDRDTIQPLGQQRLTIRDLVTTVGTSSNLVEFVRQISRSNRAAVVAEGAQKPESDIEAELAEAPVRTIATFLDAPRQTLDDSSALASLVDNELRFMVRQVEEEEVVMGDGTGQHLHGIVPQASVFSAPFTIADENPLDKILLAILQAQTQSKLPVDGVVMDPLTWGELISLKDGEQRYLAGAAGGPFGAIASRIWQVPVVTCETLARGEVLVGAFRLGAKIFDRLQMEVLISTESGDNFKTNMVTVRAEERLALAVRVPSAFVFIDELGQGFSSG